MFAWKVDKKDFHSAQWRRDEKKTISMDEVLPKAPRTNLCVESFSHNTKIQTQQLQVKVNSSNSICHGLHGCKIKTFSCFKSYRGFTLAAAYFFKHLFTLADFQFEEKRIQKPCI